MIAISIALVVLGLLAWDGLRRYLADRKAAYDAQITALDKRITAVRDAFDGFVCSLDERNNKEHEAIRVAFETLRKSVGKHEAALTRLDDELGSHLKDGVHAQPPPVDVSEFRAELTKHEAALKTMFEDVRDNYVRKDELQEFETKQKAAQSALVMTAPRRPRFGGYG